MSAGARGAARTLALAALAAILCGCASLGDRTPPIQYLDRDTGTTYRLVSRPMVFAHSQPQTAAHSRDYATVAAAWIDRDGDARYALFVYLWSTVDPRDDPGRPGAPGALTLVADDRLIRLSGGVVPRSDARDVPPIDRPPVRHPTLVEFLTDRDSLRSLAAAGHVALWRAIGSSRLRYSLWSDGRGALTGLIRAEGRGFP